MKAASLAINTDTFSQPIKNELFPVDENSTCTSAATDDHGPEVPLSILSSMPSYGNSDDPMNLDSSACWNMPEDLDMSSLLDPSLWSFDSSTQQSPSNNLQHPLEGDSCKTNSGHGTFQTPTNDPSWINGQFHIPPTPSYSLPSTRPQSPISNVSSDASNNNNSSSSNNNSSNNDMANQLFPPTPPVESQPMFFGNLGGIQAPIPLNMHNQFPQQRQQPQQCLMSSPFDTQPTPAISHSVPPFSQRSTIPQNKLTQRRRSDQSPYRKNSSTSSTPGVRRRASSVASVVSLTAHEPIAHFVDGIEHITFLYSHDRLIKEYTVRTDVNNLNLDDVPMEFRLQNAIYPRANVEREDYDGNRWKYETSCNELGWKLCWLNRDQLFGKRGLIQRAVDSYRNRHAELRSRRVTRQEKLANGTLRIRRAKKLNRPLF